MSGAARDQLKEGQAEHPMVPGLPKTSLGWGSFGAEAAWFRFGISLHPWEEKGGGRGQGKPGRVVLQGWVPLPLWGTGAVTALGTRPAAPAHC